MRTRRQMMRSEAISRVLARSMDRAAIGSLDDLRRAYEAELAAHGLEIAAKTDELFAMMRETDRRVLRTHLKCRACNEPLADAQRISRRYCSDRCRQQAHRLAKRPAP